MADFNSKYTGEQVEALLDIVSQGGSGGGEGGEVEKTTEAEITAMGFTKNLGTITEVKMNGVSKGTSGVVDLGNVLTEHQDISGKQDTISDLATIREGASKGATALQSVPTEYVTETELNNKGYATISALEDKVDKVTGKQLSTEDFTTALKTKLEGLSNYNDAEISSAVSSLQTQLNTLVSGNANDAINSFNEIIAFLDGVKDTQDLASIIASIEQQIAAKMDKVTLATVATSGSYNDLSNKPTIPSAVTESTVSGWGFTKNVGTITGIKMNGASKGTSGFVDLGTVITSHQDISGKVDKVAGKGLSTNDFTDTAKDQLDGLMDWYAGADTDIAYLMSNSARMYKTEFDINDLYTIYNDQTYLVSCGKDEIVQAVKLGKVVCVPYSKDDLSLGYIIADATVEELLYINLMGTDNDFFSIGTDYTQSGLFAEDIIYNSFHKKQDKLVSGTNIKTINGTSILGSGDIAISGGGGGTITGVSANGTSIATSGVANIPAASTSAYGVTKLSSATNSTSTTLAATASAVKSAYDLANSYKGTVTGVKINGTTKSPTSGTVDLGTVITSHQDISGKQDKLVSGTNIKTINGTSILGSGNITISGGGGSSSGGGAYAQVNHGTSDTTFTLTPNTFHVWDEVSALTLSLGSETAGVANEFVFQFTSGATATSLTLPDGIKWAEVEAPSIKENATYQISILNNFAVILEYATQAVLIDNYCTYSDYTLTFDYPVASEVTVEYDHMFGSDAVVFEVGQQSITVDKLIMGVYNITPSGDSVYYYCF